MKTFIIAFLCLSTISASTQIQVGGGLCYGTEIEKLGIALKGEKSITEEIDASAAIHIFFPHKISEGAFSSKMTMWSINADGHYVFEVGDNATAYPLAGLNVAIVSFETETSILGEPYVVDGSDTEIGLNIGGGGQLNFNEQLTGFAELKYVLSSFDQLVISFGVLFNI